ncbi:MAG: hypothetical protein ACLPRE_10955 [Limisphaerales bacterium]
MTGKMLVENARKAKRKLCAKCSKFAGAATTEILRSALAREGITTSARDVFIRGVGLEIDLVITRKTVKPEMGLIYEPRDVALALEVKKSGSYGKEGLEKIKSDFKRLKRVGVECAYVSFEDRENYKWKPTEEKLGGFKCFTFAWHKDTDSSFAETGAWERLVEYLKKTRSGKFRRKSQTK